ncbi:putative glycine-rich cell wall structural protein 1 [Pyrus x bretschneideri]|uniref:putative glycine-rich cell wall structural protein 1 n=1 Tax=Pyrus x bretschneideri TaxID=225117 RepID=UPI00202E24E5|nr:putative glycine-rich cell wall structural protein 1 [Pyrus x bretschneideri]
MTNGHNSRSGGNNNSDGNGGGGCGGGGGGANDVLVGVEINDSANGSCGCGGNGGGCGNGGGNDGCDDSGEGCGYGGGGDKGVRELLTCHHCSWEMHGQNHIPGNMQPSPLPGSVLPSSGLLQDALTMCTVTVTSSAPFNRRVVEEQAAATA